MAAAVITVTKPSDTRGYKEGNRRVHFRDITADTGTYTTGGFTLTASDLGMRHVDMVDLCGLATCGTSGATALGVGVTYPTTGGAGTTVLFQIYEAAATGLPFLEKTNTEAYPASFTFRVKVTGF